MPRRLTFRCRGPKPARCAASIPLTPIVRPSHGESIDTWVIRSRSPKGPFNAGLVPLPSCHDSTISWQQCHVPFRVAVQIFNARRMFHGRGRSWLQRQGHPRPNLAISGDQNPRVAQLLSPEQQSLGLERQNGKVAAVGVCDLRTDLDHLGDHQPALQEASSRGSSRCRKEVCTSALQRRQARQLTGCNVHVSSRLSNVWRFASNQGRRPRMVLRLGHHDSVAGMWSAHLSFKQRRIANAT